MTGFIEVKVNGGRYNTLQQAKDAIIGTEGGILLSPVRDIKYKVGSKVVLETGLANVTTAEALIGAYDPQSDRTVVMVEDC